MPNPFVWFDNAGSAKDETATFLAKMFGWNTQEAGPNVVLSEDGQDMPFGLTGDGIDGVTGWVPYVEVDDLNAATAKAEGAGGTVIAADVAGPAGTATFVKDPGNAVIALWKRGSPE